MSAYIDIIVEGEYRAKVKVLDGYGVAFERGEFRIIPAMDRGAHEDSEPYPAYGDDSLPAKIAWERGLEK